MNVHFLPLLLAVALLWFPRAWLRLGLTVKRRRRHGEHGRTEEPWNARVPGDPRVSFRSEFTKFRNYVDLLRGAAGCLVLFGGLGFTPGLEAVSGAGRTVVWEILVIRALILLVGLLIQTLRYEHHKVTFYPPIFYLAGLSVGLCDIRGAGFAFALIWAINPALGNAQAFLTLYAIFMTVFGYFFGSGGRMSIALAGLLSFLPVLLSLLANRPLTVFTRKGTRTAHV